MSALSEENIRGYPETPTRPVDEALTPSETETSENVPFDAPTSDVEKLHQEVARLNNHRFLRTYNSLPRLLAFNFAR